MANAQRNGQEFVSAVRMAAHLNFDRAYLAKLSPRVRLCSGPTANFRSTTIAGLTWNFSGKLGSAVPSPRPIPRSRRPRPSCSNQIAERKKELMMASECYELLDEVHGLFMTHLSALPAKIGGRDLAMRRRVEKAIFDMRVELSNEAAKRANERGEPDEPPLSEQGPQAGPT